MQKSFFDWQTSLLKMVCSIEVPCFLFAEVWDPESLQRFHIAMLCANWYHLYNLKNVKDTHGVVFLKPATSLKVTLLHGCFSRFLNCSNCTKLRNAPFLLCIMEYLNSYLCPHQYCIMIFSQFSYFENLVLVKDFK